VRKVGEISRGRRFLPLLSDWYFVGNWLRQLVDELNDPTGAGLDQHGAAVHDRVVVAPGAAIFGRNVVIADSGLGQDRTNCEGLRIRVRRHLLTNDIFAETRSIIDAQNAGNPAGHTANHPTDDSTERTRSSPPSAAPRAAPPGTPCAWIESGNVSAISVVPRIIDFVTAIS